MKLERFFIGRDQSSHTYLVPVAKRALWAAWVAIDEDDPRAWVVPDYARSISGSHSITFTDPHENV